MTEKLQKILAAAGYGSRREIERWIDDGRITVNGKRAKLGDRALSSDRILIDGKLTRLQAQSATPLKALMYHKPDGVICSKKDPQGRPTIFDGLPALPNGRWVAVGRLDINTTGLLLFVNNGDLANKLMHPSTGLEREYLCRVRGEVSEETILKLTQQGVELDGAVAKFQSVLGADLSEEGTNHWYRVIIREGRNREVRRIWEAVGHPVSRLKRIRYGTVKLSRDQRRGKYEKMAPKQLEKLVEQHGLKDEFQTLLYSAGRSQNRNATAPKRTKFKNSEQRTFSDGNESETKRPQGRARVPVRKAKRSAIDLDKTRSSSSAKRGSSSGSKSTQGRRNAANKKPQGNRNRKPR
jgi:23S rRNA pseudouridine2605 synthase